MERYNVRDYTSLLHPENYDAIERNMLDPSHQPGQTTFTDVVHVLSIAEPEVIAFTANSAIPVADAVSGFYKQLGMPSPKLIPIRTNRKVSRDHEVGKTNKSSKESKRLSRYVRGQRTAIIDQFTITRNTIRLGREMLLNAGAATVVTHPNTRWYDQANPADIFIEDPDDYNDPYEIQAPASVHEDFMREIGRKAALLVKNNLS